MFWQVVSNLALFDDPFQKDVFFRGFPKPHVLRAVASQQILEAVS